jgi:hypothetical protein
MRRAGLVECHRKPCQDGQIGVQSHSVDAAHLEGQECPFRPFYEGSANHWGTTFSPSVGVLATSGREVDYPSSSAAVTALAERLAGLLWESCQVTEDAERDERDGRDFNRRAHARTLPRGGAR